jgi:hypothetical protein
MDIIPGNGVEEYRAVRIEDYELSIQRLQVAFSRMGVFHFSGNGG